MTISSFSSQRFARSRLGNPWLAAFLGVLIFLADILSKYCTQLYLPSYFGFIEYPYGGIAIFKNFLGIEFSLVHATNRGAAWGLLAEYQNYLLVLRCGLVLGLGAYLCLSTKHPEWRIPLTLILAGAIGNIADYFLYGHVIDMFHFILWGYDYPVFNIADSAIFIGICWLFLCSIFDSSQAKQ